MSTEHVRAVLRYLHDGDGDGDRGPMLRSGCGGSTNREWMLLLGAELRRRAKAPEGAWCQRPPLARG